MGHPGEFGTARIYDRWTALRLGRYLAILQDGKVGKRAARSWRRCSRSIVAWHVFDSVFGGRSEAACLAHGELDRSYRAANRSVGYVRGDSLISDFNVLELTEK